MKTSSIVVGILFILAAILGFLGVAAGTGIVVSGVADNLIRLIVGIIFIWVAYAGSQVAMKNTFLTFGVIYILLSLAGFIFTPAGGPLLGFIDTTSVDNWIRLIVGIVLIALPMIMTRQVAESLRHATR
jgi:hypothetical protein